MSLQDARCPDPIGAAVLLDYWLDTLEDENAARAEEHLFGCDVCGGRLRHVAALLDSLRAMAQSGTVKVAVDSGFARRVTDAGRKVREYAPPSGGSIQCTVSADDDFLLGRLAADLGGVGRIDLAFFTPAGVELGRMMDVPFDKDAGAVVYQESMTFAKGAGSNTLLVRLLAVEPHGAERVLGDFTFVHTRTIPGPPAW